MVAEADIARAVAALAEGRLVVFPTETVYGIGCDASNPAAVERLCAAKGRPAEKGIAVILGDAWMLDTMAGEVSSRAAALARRFWPGPLTLLVPARSGLPPPLVRDGYTGCRVSSDGVARALSARLGRPIASPSANPTGLEPACDIATARGYFGAAAEAYLDDGRRQGAPSTLVDPGPPLRILRAGAVPAAAIAAALA